MNINQIHFLNALADLFEQYSISEVYAVHTSDRKNPEIVFRSNGENFSFQNWGEDGFFFVKTERAGFKSERR